MKIQAHQGLALQQWEAVRYLKLAMRDKWFRCKQARYLPEHHLLLHLRQGQVSLVQLPKPQWSKISVWFRRLCPLLELLHRLRQANLPLGHLVKLNLWPKVLLRPHLETSLAHRLNPQQVAHSWKSQLWFEPVCQYHCSNTPFYAKSEKGITDR